VFSQAEGDAATRARDIDRIVEEATLKRRGYTLDAHTSRKPERRFIYSQAAG
jgi:hypothetical protein